MVATILYDAHDQYWADLAPRLVELTKFKLYPVVPIVCQDLHATLLSTDEPWAVVIAAGSVIHKPGIVNDIVDYCQQEKSPLAGHILHRNGYYHLHPQFFCINVELYKQWAQGLEPIVGLHTITSVSIERSTDNVHDDYTPWWIQPADNEPKTINCADAFGSRYIAWLMNQGHKVVNIPHNIRGNKIYGYPEYNHQDIRNFIADTVITAQESGANQFLSYLKNNLEALNLGFYPINTEPVTALVQPVDSLNVFTGVCGGIKPAIITSQSQFAANTKVVLFDISEIAIEWQKWLRNQWDGGRDTIDSVFNEFMQTYPNARAQYFSYMGILGNFDWVLKNNCSEQEFKQKWAHWKTLDVEYHCLNLLNSQDQQTLIDTVTQLGDSVYIWTSNLFFMDWHLLMHEPGHAKRCYDQFVGLIKTSQHSVVLENENYITVY